jgi:hypothetical protein
MKRRFDFSRFFGVFVAANALIFGCSLGKLLGGEGSKVKKEASAEAKRAIAEESKAVESEETAEEVQAAMPVAAEDAASQEDVKAIEALTMKWCQAYQKEAWGSQWDMLGKASQVRKQFHDSLDSFEAVSYELVCPLLSCEVRAVRVLKDRQNRTRRRNGADASASTGNTPIRRKTPWCWSS